MNINKLKCKIGLHKWIYSRPLMLYDIHLLYSKHKTPERECQYCNRKEKWLPGYGGSEIGCWLKDGI